MFHNLSGHDTHLFIKEEERRKEKYISFNVKINVKLVGVSKDATEVYRNVQLRLIDSCRFMALSLGKLASNLDDDQCKHLSEFYKEEDVFMLMRCKGVYPFEYMDSWKKFEETSLPPKDVFYSRFNINRISDQDYKHAQQVWNRITPGHENITLEKYHDVYLATVVLLLAEVFQTFWDTRLKHCKLDPAHFYTALGLAWQALLKTAAGYCEHERNTKRLRIMSRQV